MNTTELKAIAEKATPGPWRHEEIDPTDPGWGACEIFAAADDYVATHVCNVKDAAHIAAANPAAILELIAAHEDARGEIRALRATEQALRERVTALEEGRGLLQEAMSMLGSRLIKDTFGYEWHEKVSALLEKKP